VWAYGRPACLFYNYMSTPRLCQVCRASPATHHCFCRTPWIYLCTVCSTPHSSTEGKHLVLPLRPASPSSVSSVVQPLSQVCESCAQNPAEKQLEETWVCSACAQVFEGSTQATSTRSPTALTMEDLKSVLEGEIQSAKGVLSCARDTYDRVIREVHRQKMKTMQGISRSVEELERMVQEYIVNPVAEVNISKMCFETPKGDSIRDELQLIRYHSDIDELCLKIPSIFTYSPALWLFLPQSPPLPDLIPPIIPLFRKFNFQYSLPACQESPMRGNVQPLHDCTAWLFVTEEYLFLCGEARKFGAYIVAISGFVYNSTAPSIYKHEHPCIGRYSDHVYLFGGELSDVPQKYCERYTLSQDSWSALPNMQFPRSESLPCLHNDQFYLLGGKWNSTAEQFDPVKSRFKTLTLEMPFHGFMFAIEYDQDLYCFSHGRVFSWELKMGAEYLTEVVDVSDDIFFFVDTGNPVRIRDEIYFFGNNIKEKQSCLYSFDLSTKRFTEKARVGLSLSLFGR